MPGHLPGHMHAETLAGTLAGAHAGTLTGTLAGTRNWSGCSSAVTTTPQILEAGRPRPQEKGVPGHLPGHLHLPGQTLGREF